VQQSNPKHRKLGHLSQTRTEKQKFQSHTIEKQKHEPDKHKIINRNLRQHNTPIPIQDNTNTNSRKHKNTNMNSINHKITNMNPRQDRKKTLTILRT
jgi:hypothetical protein